MIIENYDSFNKKFCVYVFLDPRKPGIYKFGDLCFEHEPIYIGKGTESRPKRHLFLYKRSSIRFYNKLKSIVRDGHDPLYQILYKNLTEVDSFLEEKRLILLIGRVESGGTLLNLSDGGEGQSGFKHSEESKKKTSTSIRNNKEWLDYMKSDEFSDKVSKSLMGHEGYGKGVPRKDEVKDKIRNSVTGDKNHFFGKTHSKQSKEKMSFKRKGKMNSNSKRYNIKIDDKVLSFEGRNELKSFIENYNIENNLLGPKRVSMEGLLNNGTSKNFELVSITPLNK